MKRSALFGAAAAAFALSPAALQAQSATKPESRDWTVTITLGHRPSPAKLPADFALFDNKYQRFIYVASTRCRALEAGDIIKDFNGASATSVAELEKRIRDAGGGQPARFKLIRGGRLIPVSFALDREVGAPFLGLDLGFKSGFASVESAHRRGSAACLKKGDILLALAGRPVRDAKALGGALDGRKCGEAIPLSFLRGGELKSEKITLIPKPQPGFIGIQRLDEKGQSKIVAVIPGTAAEKAGLAAGQLIVAVNGRPLSSSFKLAQAMAGTRPGQTVTLTVRKP